MLTTTQRWLALQTRDPKYHTAFIYAVKTTRIYCRPTCPSRLARQANIVYYNSPSEAEAAGYRACKRCHPEDLDGWDPKKDGIVERARVAIEGGEVEIGLKDLAKMVKTSEWHLLRSFKKEMGVTPRGYWGVVCERRSRASNNIVLGEDGVDQLMREIEAEEEAEENVRLVLEEFVDFDEAL